MGFLPAHEKNEGEERKNELHGKVTYQKEIVIQPDGVFRAHGK